MEMLLEDWKAPLSAFGKGTMLLHPQAEQLDQLMVMKSNSIVPSKSRRILLFLGTQTSLVPRTSSRWLLELYNGKKFHSGRNLQRKLHETRIRQEMFSALVNPAPVHRLRRNDTEVKFAPEELLFGQTIHSFS